LARAGPNLLQGGRGGRPVIYFKAGSATTEGPGPDPQPTFTLNLLLFGIYFQRPAGSSPCFAPRRRAPSARVPHGGAHRALRGALIGWRGPQRYTPTPVRPGPGGRFFIVCSNPLHRPGWCGSVSWGPASVPRRGGRDYGRSQDRNGQVAVGHLAREPPEAFGCIARVFLAQQGEESH
jgi:hypothetical protein